MSSTPVVSSTGTGKVTGEQRVAKVFGLTGSNWTRHPNPVSVAGLVILQTAKACADLPPSRAR
jgi:hypothetical protein